jgi:hypothetical protein
MARNTPTVTPYSSALGAVISGVDLGRPLDDAPTVAGPGRPDLRQDRSVCIPPGTHVRV